MIMNFGYLLTSIFPTIIIVSYVGLSFINSLYSPQAFYTMLLLLVGSAAFVVESIQSIRSKQKEVIIIFCLILFGYILSSGVGQKFRLIVLVQTLSGMGYALLLVNRKMNGLLIKGLFFTVACYFTISAYAGINPNELFYSSSRNGVSAFSILVTVLFYSTNHQGVLPLYPSIINFAISIWAEGRSGIVASLLLLILLVLYNWKTGRTGLYKKITFLGCIIVIVPLIYYFQTEALDIITNLRFHLNIFDDLRMIMINDYIAHLDAYSLLVGVEPQMTVAESELGGNFHNSFLSMHSNYGLLAALIIIGSILFLGFKKNNFCHSMASIMLLTILIRIWSDALAFPGLFDPVIYYYIFVKPPVLR